MGSNPKQFIGIATVRADGKELLSKKGAKFRPTGVNRNEVKYAGGVGFSEEFESGMVTVNRITDADRDVIAESQMANVSIEFTADTGQSFMLANSWLENVPEITAEDGGNDTLTFKSGSVSKV